MPIRALLLLCCLLLPFTARADDLGGRLWSVQQQRFISWEEFYRA